MKIVIGNRKKNRNDERHKEMIDLDLTDTIPVISDDLLVENEKKAKKKASIFDEAVFLGEEYEDFTEELNFEELDSIESFDSELSDSSKYETASVGDFTEEISISEEDLEYAYLSDDATFTKLKKKINKKNKKDNKKLSTDKAYETEQLAFESDGELEEEESEAEYSELEEEESEAEYSELEEEEPEAEYSELEEEEPEIEYSELEEEESEIEYSELEEEEPEIEYSELEEEEPEVEYSELEEEKSELDYSESEETIFDSEEYIDEEEEIFYDKELEFEEEKNYSDEFYYEKKSKKAVKNSNNRKKTNFAENLLSKLKGLSLVDFAVCGGGVIVAIAIIFIVIFAKGKGNNSQVEDGLAKGETRYSENLSEIGTKLENIGIAGEDGLMAITNTALLSEISEEELVANTEETEEEEKIETKEIQVSFTSYEKDFKAKFADSGTNALIKNVPFQVTLTSSSGKQLVYKDEDGDGIIYQTGVSAGDYSALVDDVEGYTFAAYDSKVNIKDKIVYKQVDVSQEIKKESEVNVAQDDTGAKNQQAEAEASAYKENTVEWVDSNKSEEVEALGYTKIEKSEILEPTYAMRNIIEVTNKILSNDGRSAFSQKRIGVLKKEPDELPDSQNNIENTDNGDKKEENENSENAEEENRREENENSENAENENKKEENENSENAENENRKEENENSENAENGNRKEESENTYNSEKKDSTDNKSERTASISFGSDIILAEGATLKLNPEAKYDGNTLPSTLYKNWSSSDLSVVTVDSEGKITGKSEGEATISVKYECSITEDNVTIKYTGEGSAKIKVTKEKITVSEISIATDSINIVKGKTETLSAEAKFSDDSTTKSGLKYFSDNEDLVKVDESNGIITAINTGETKVRIKYTDSYDNTKEATINVKVTDEESKEIKITSLALSKERTSLAVGKTETISSEAIMSDDSKITAASKFTYSSKDESIAKVSNLGVITAVKTGETEITVKYKDSFNNEKTANLKVIVVNDIKEDTTSKLKDKDGRQVYIKDSEGKFVEATFADYYKDLEFFINDNEEKVVKYTGWQTIDGNVYYFDKDGNKVTGSQVIQGVTYNFSSEGVLQMEANSSMGIDVSKWNGNIDWQAVKNSGVSFVIIRCGYRGSTSGALIEDSKFHSNIQGAQAAGLKVGVYFYTQAVSEAEAVEEASMTLSLIRNYSLAYPVYIDTERSGGRGDKIDKATRTAVVVAFCETIKNGGYKPGVYASKSWYNDNLSYSSLSGYNIWLARYASTADFPNRYDIWQYSEKGSVSGIKGTVDLNIGYMGY